MSESGTRHVFHHEEHVMGTVVTLDLYDEREPVASVLNPIVADAIAVLHRADAMFSTWNPTSPMSQLRRGVLSLEDAPSEIIVVLERCREAKAITRGWFDPWAMPGGVDPTGLVKGWAAQRCLDVLRRSGADGALVNAAGDIASFGGPSWRQRFRIGIADPANPRHLACVVETPGAIATSGTYERGAHLIDPKVGEARTRAASATVVGTDLAVADALATALVVAGETALSIFDDLIDYEGLVITTTGVLQATPGFPLSESLTSGLAR